MEFPGLPAAKTVEQAILLAQLQILRQTPTPKDLPNFDKVKETLSKLK